MIDLSDMTNYTNSEIGISILIPQPWTVETINDGQFRIFGLPEAGFEEYFEEYRPTMSYVLATPENSEVDWFQRLIERSNLDMVKEYNKYQVISEERYQISDRSAYVKHYEWTEDNTGLRLSQLQSLIQATSQSFYLVNAAAIKTIADKYMPVFDAILKSTKILP